MAEFRLLWKISRGLVSFVVEHSYATTFGSAVECHTVEAHNFRATLNSLQFATYEEQSQPGRIITMSATGKVTKLYEKLGQTWMVLIVGCVLTPISTAYSIVEKHLDSATNFSIFDLVMLASSGVLLFVSPLYLRKEPMKTTVTSENVGQFSIVFSRPFQKSTGWKGMVSDVQKIVVYPLEKRSFTWMAALVLTEGREVALQSYLGESAAIEEVNAIARAMGLDGSRVSVETDVRTVRPVYEELKKDLYSV